MTKRLLVYDKAGSILLEVDSCSNPMPIVEMSLNKIGEFAYEQWEWKRQDTEMQYFNPEGAEITEEEFHTHVDLKPYDVTKLPFWVDMTSSYPDRIMSHEFFTDKNGLHIVYVKAKDRHGHYLTLYNIDKDKEVWTLENDKKGYEFSYLPAVSENGDLILVTRTKSWNSNESDYDTFRQISRTCERLFLNKNGKIIHNIREFGGVKMTNDGKKLLIYDDAGNFKMYSIATTR